MARTTVTLFAALLLAAIVGSPALAAHKEPHAIKKEPAGCGDGYPLGFGFGWTSKYYPVYQCPGFSQHRPWNPLHQVPYHSGLGQTGPRRILLWPPGIGSPLYNNTPMLAPVPPAARKCPGLNCPY